jgi:hypothetical protein
MSSIQQRAKARTWCAVEGCGRIAKRGSVTRYCNRHLHRLLKHGSVFGRAILVRELKPYRRQARQWLRANRKDPAIIVPVAMLDEWLTRCLVWATDRPRPETIPRRTSFRWRLAWELARLRAAGVRGDRAAEVALSVWLFFEHHQRSERWRQFTMARHVLNLSPHHRTSAGLSSRLSSEALEHLGRYLTDLLQPLTARLASSP